MEEAVVNELVFLHLRDGEITCKVYSALKK